MASFQPQFASGYKSAYVAASATSSLRSYAASAHLSGGLPKTGRVRTPLDGSVPLLTPELFVQALSRPVLSHKSIDIPIFEYE